METNIIIKTHKKKKITFIRTFSLNFSLLIILIATFLPVTQWTPSLTRPEIKKYIINKCKYEYFRNMRYFMTNRHIY